MDLASQHKKIDALRHALGRRDTKDCRRICRVTSLQRDPEEISIKQYMATQDDSGVPFSIAREQQNFRLLELPDELVQLLSSENAPT